MYCTMSRRAWWGVGILCAVHTLDFQRGIERFRECIVIADTGSPDRASNTELRGMFGGSWSDRYCLGSRSRCNTGLERH